MRRSKLLKDRQTGIGGSDAPAILGVHPYRTIVDVYFEKTGELPPQDDNKDMKRGRVLEPVIADLFAEETGAKLHKERMVRRNPVKDYLIAHLDRVILSMPNETTSGILEIKAPRANQFDKWKEGPPDDVFVQIQHYIGVAGYDYAYACAWIGATDLVWHRVARDPKFIALLFEKEQEFWEQNVLKGVVPYGRASLVTLDKLYPDSHAAHEVALENNMAQWLEIYFNSRRVRLAMEKAELEAEEYIKTKMGDAERAIFNNGEVLFGVSWKSSAPFRLWNLEEMEKDDDLVQRFKNKISSRRTFTVKKKVIGLLAAPKDEDDA